MNDDHKAVFLSYASQDAEAAKRICETLRQNGVEVWFDQSELRGGDAWDQKIRKQIKECALFVPIISAHTDARAKGYFRREWKLAVDCTQDMADDLPFLVPVVIDDTADATARVPEKFREVQWTRLRDGETRPAFCDRIKKLLNGGVGARPPPAAELPLRLRAAAVPQKSRRWLWPAILGGLACAALAFWMFGARFGTAVEKAATSNAKPALSEARKLVAQARTLFEDGDESNHENVFLAEDLLKRAESLDSTDAEVWAAQAQVSRLMSVLGYDRTRARKDALQKQAERAWKLDPASVEAQVAYASYLADVGGATAEEAIRILEPLSERQPGHRGVWGALGLAYAAAGKANELVVAFDRANALPGGDARALSIKGTQLVWFGRYAEAEAALAESLAVKSTGRAHAFGVLLKLCWRGDLDAAAADLERWPTWLRLEPRGAFVMSQVWLWRREPDKAIAALNAAPRDAWNDTYFTGPKAVLLALAHELAGRPQAARAEWENTRTVANRLLAEDPTLRAALAYKGVALARLGETAEAETLLRQLEQNQSLQAEFWSCAAPSALLRIALGHGAEVTAKFETEQRIARLKTVYPSPQAALRLNPVFEPIRATPEFQRMLAAAPAPKPRNPAAAAARVEQKSIAVLAFENRSSEKDSEYFSDGISEELLNVLSKVPGLRVAARTSSFYFKVKPASLKEIARELNVFYLVEGSVQRDGSRARIGASLFRADTGDTIWADRFDTELKDIFTAQDEIARLIASKLSLNLSAPSRPARVVDPAMHGLVLEGRYFLTQRDTGFPRAEAAFAQALKLDPEFAPAHAGLAAVHVLKAVFRIIDGVGGNAAGLAEGRRFAQQALALDASLVDAHSTAGYEALLSGRFNESEQHFQRGLAVNPNDAFTHHWRAHLLARLGQLDRALEENALAAELDPFSWALLSGYSGQLALACRHQDTLTALERLLAIRPNFLPAQGLAAVQMLRLGRSAEAIALARQVLENPQPSQRQWADVSAVQVLHEGQLDGDVRTYAAKVLASYPAEDPRRPALLAAAGRFEEALVTPIKSPVDPFNARFYFWAEAWDPIRDEPRFEQRIAQLGLTNEYKVARETLQRMLKQPKLKKP